MRELKKLEDVIGEVMHYTYDYGNPLITQVTFNWKKGNKSGYLIKWYCHSCERPGESAIGDANDLVDLHCASCSSMPIFVDEAILHLLNEDMRVAVGLATIKTALGMPTSLNAFDEADRDRDRS